MKESVEGRPVVNTGPGRTKKSFKDECDINRIVAKHRKTGMISHLANGTPFYGDVSNITDYHGALEKVRVANELFMKMSSQIRDRFDNDPGKMVEFLEDEKNLDEAVSLGMVIKRPVEAPVEPAPVQG